MNELFKLATTELSFIFDNKLFNQIDGVAIGSPFSLTMANTLPAIMKKLGSMNVLWYWACGIQTFVLFKSKENFKLFVNYMNSKHSNIKLTFETEDSNNFPFLDVKIMRQRKRFVASIFLKATLSGL